MTTSLYDFAVTDVAPAAQEVIEIATCPVCAHRHGRRILQVGDAEFAVVRCERCGLGRLWPPPTPEQIAGFYPPEYYGAAGRKFTPVIESLVRWAAKQQARSLSRGLPGTCRVLDVGCGRGVLLNAFADLGHTAYGFELSDSAAAGVDPRAQIRTGDSLEKAQFPAETFDLVILWHVLEHAPEPRKLVEEIHRTLKPGGRFAVAVPNFSSLQARWTKAAWFHLDLPRHLFHFPSNALQDLLQTTGFECLQERHFCLRQNPFGWIQSGLNRCSPFPRNSLYNLLQNREPAETGFADILARPALRLIAAVMAPAALAMSVLAASVKRGATVQIVARKVASSAAQTTSTDPLGSSV